MLPRVALLDFPRGFGVIAAGLCPPKVPKFDLNLGSLGPILDHILLNFTGLLARVARLDFTREYCSVMAAAGAQKDQEKL